MNPPDRPPNISLTGQMQAEIKGVSRGTDNSLIVLGVICLVGTLGCFWLSLWQPWAGIGAAAFLVGFFYVLYVWRQGAAARTQAEAPPAQLNWKSGGDEWALTVPTDSQNYVVKRVLAVMRILIQDREPLPRPRGKVEGNPSDEKSLKEYSEQERKQVETTWSDEISKHDQIVVEQLESAAFKSLDSKPDDARMPQLGNSD